MKVWNLAQEVSNHGHTTSTNSIHLSQIFMSSTFYHVDRHGDLDVGSTMELEWPPRLSDQLITVSPEENMETLEDLYPEGLSRHGARYAQTGLISQEVDGLNDGWDAMAGLLEANDIAANQTGKTFLTPHNVQYEFMFELYRMLKFEDKQSRFQSYFAVEELEDAVQFAENYRGTDSDIFEVECEDYEVRDMELVKLEYLGHIFTHGEKYWNGEPGSNPEWEVVMEPPVEIVDVIDNQ